MPPVAAMGIASTSAPLPEPHWDDLAAPRDESYAEDVATLQDGFGWTNGVLRLLLDLYPACPSE